MRVDIDVEISLSNKTFKEELNNKSSPAFKELAKDVYTEVLYSTKSCCTKIVVFV